MFRKASHRDEGFTLIELLVVIAIIAVLTGIGLASFQGAQEKARDARRKEDYKAIQTALQAYYNDNGYFPPAATTADWVCSNNASSSPWISGLTSQYIKQIPVDPINNSGDPWGISGSPTSSGGYRYCYGTWNPYVSGAAASEATKPQKYDLVMQLENHNDPDVCGYKGWIFNYFGYSWCPGDSGNSTIYNKTYSPNSAYSNYIYAPNNP